MMMAWYRCWKWYLHTVLLLSRWCVQPFKLWHEAPQIECNSGRWLVEQHNFCSSNDFLKISWFDFNLHFFFFFYKIKEEQSITNWFCLFHIWLQLNSQKCKYFLIYCRPKIETVKKTCENGFYDEIQINPLAYTIYPLETLNWIR